MNNGRVGVELRRSRVEKFLDAGIIPGIAVITVIFAALLILRSEEVDSWCITSFCMEDDDFIVHFLEVLITCTQFLSVVFYVQLAVLQLIQSIRSNCRFGVCSDLGQVRCRTLNDKGDEHIHNHLFLKFFVLF